MFRKVTLALAAVAALGLTALAPTSASAGGKKHWGHHHHSKHWGFYPGYISFGYGYGCWVKRWVDTPWGPRLKKVYVCY